MSGARVAVAIQGVGELAGGDEARRMAGELGFCRLCAALFGEAELGLRAGEHRPPGVPPADKRAISRVQPAYGL